MFTYTCEYEYVWISANRYQLLRSRLSWRCPSATRTAKVPLVPPLSLLASLASCQTCHKTCHQSPSASACVLLEMWGRRRGAIKWSSQRDVHSTLFTLSSNFSTILSRNKFWLFDKVPSLFMWPFVQLSRVSARPILKAWVFELVALTSLVAHCVLCEFYQSS